jgi:hypothetical protein
MRSITVLTVLFLILTVGCETRQEATEKPMTPEQIVALFHESYGTAWMDDIGPYTTADFRDQLPVTVWIIDTWDWLQEMEYEKLEFKVAETQISKDGDYATVASRTRVRTIDGESVQNEIFILIREEGLWYIDEMYVTDEAPAANDQRL